MPARSGVAVAIVSNNPETLDGLQQYLAAAGVPCRSTRALDGPPATRAVASTVILFPDDFPAREALAFLRQLREARPKALAILVTREPGRFREAAAPDGRSRTPLLLPKPVFGWAILDAIRAHLQDSTLP